MRAIFMGTPSYAVPVLETLLSLDGRVVGVYTQPDKPSGRGRILEPSPVKVAALEHGITVLQPTALRRIEEQQKLASLKPDVIVVAAYGKILPREVLDIPPYGCVNVHPSLLPKYRGPSPVATAILEGENRTGTTLILLDEGMDTGPMLSSDSVPIHNGVTTTEDLTYLLFSLGAQLLQEVLPLWLESKVIPRPQNHGQASLTKKLEKGDGEARWDMPAEELERRVRAFTPWPGLFTHWKGRLLKILSAVCYSTRSGAPPDVGALRPSAPGVRGEPGTVVPLERPDVAVGVVTGRGILGLRGLQIEGRRAVSSEEFVRGYRDFPGSKLPS